MRARSTRRGRLSGVFLLVAAVQILCACSTREPKVFHVGVLCGLDVFATTVDGFRAGMSELGYVEGGNIVYDVHRLDFEPDSEKSILQHFVSSRVDAILALPTEIAVEAKEAVRGTSIPVVFCQTYIEGTDLIGSVRKPGGNLTGVRYPGPDLGLKRFEVMRELVPQARRIWVPYWKDSMIVPGQLELIRPAASKAGLTLVEAPVAGAADLEKDLESRGMNADVGIDAILFVSEPLARTRPAFPMIGKFAAEHKLPICGVHISMDGYSTLFGVATDNVAVGRLAARQMHRIFQGTPAGSIPVVSAESYLQINYAVAQELKLTVPEGLLKEADEVIH